MEEPQDVTADRIVRELLMPSRNNNKIEVNINAGAIGVWLACTACLVMAGMLGVGGLWLSREFNRTDAVFNDLNDKDSVHDAYIQKLNAQKTGEKK